MKKALLFVLVAVVFNAIQVIGQEIKWQNTINAFGNEYFSTVKQTPDGGYICGGTSFANISGDKTENSMGVRDYWIIKLDVSGNIEWQNTIGGSAEDVLGLISLTADGGFICGGHSRSPVSGDKTEDTVGVSDYWILKLNATGDIVWQKTIGGSDIDELKTISQTADNGFICGGTSYSNISGDKTENAIGNGDYWIIKLDSIGNIEWQNTIGGSSVDNFSDISQTNDGGFICGGYSGSDISGDKSENTNGNYDYWVLKLDATGNIEWQNTIGGNTYENLTSVFQTTDGGYICGGYSQSQLSGDHTEFRCGPQDYWIVKLDNVGNISWQITLGSWGYDNMQSLIQSSDGGYIAGGRSYIHSFNGSPCDVWEMPGNIGNEMWVVKIDPAGNILWQNTIGGIYDETIYSLIENSNGNIVCGGMSQSDISGDKTEISMDGASDWWIFELSLDYNLIKGKTYVDLNSNNSHDINEPVLRNVKIIETGTNRFGFSDQNGIYNVSVLDSGNYSVEPSSSNFNYTFNPVIQSSYFNSIEQTDSLNDFAFQPVGPVNDLKITINPVSQFRPGFDAYYSLNYLNEGTTSLTGTVILYIDSNLTYVSSSVLPSLVTTDSVVWQTGMLNPFDNGVILVDVNVNSFTPISTIVNSCAKIEPVSGDVTPVNNFTCREVVVTGSFDPNDILVDRSFITTTELLSPPYLDYIIRFQNTGNDTAFNVKIINPIDTLMLQLGTFEFVASSHPVNISWLNWERNMEFKFNNILLPDSNINEPMSHGFVRYKMKPKSSLTIGEIIKNEAFIYFDFNAAVATNETETEITDPVGIFSMDNNYEFNIYPNPVNDYINVSFNYSGPSQAEFHICNALGQTVVAGKYKTVAGSNNIQIPADLLSEGVYFLKLSVGGEEKIKKVVKLVR